MNHLYKSSDSAQTYQRLFHQTDENIYYVYTLIYTSFILVYTNWIHTRVLTSLAHDIVSDLVLFLNPVSHTAHEDKHNIYKYIEWNKHIHGYEWEKAYCTYR